MSVKQDTAISFNSGTQAPINTSTYNNSGYEESSVSINSRVVETIFTSSLICNPLKPGSQALGFFYESKKYPHNAGILTVVLHRCLQVRTSNSIYCLK